MRVFDLVDEGLGNASYLIDVGEGRGLVIDPSRDPRPYLRLAAEHGLRVAFAAETHVHADFVSGGRELAGLGAELLAPGGAGLAFPHRGLADGDEVDLGGLTLRAMHTPGHSPEHLSYLLLDGTQPAAQPTTQQAAQPVAVFTGGALIVGGIARTDLAEPERTEAWSRRAYGSARRLLALPDELPVYPTHGPGSFCSATGAGKRTSTVGWERIHNPLLAGAGTDPDTDPDADTFVARLTSSLGSYPGYFDRLPALNRRGAPRHGLTRPVLPKLTAAHVRELLSAGALPVDARPVESFAAGHIPGAISIAARPAFATWLGWLVAEDRPVVLVLDDDQDREAVVEACLKVGHDALAGELDGGIEAWRAYGGGVATIPLIDAAGSERRHVLDIRQRAEWLAGHVPGATHCELGSLPERADTVAGELAATGPTAVMCMHGERSMTGASLLAAAGARELVVTSDGPKEWTQAHGQDLELAQ